MHVTSFYLLSFKDKENQQLCVSDETIAGSVCFKANKIYNKQVLFIETCLTRVCWKAFACEDLVKGVLAGLKSRAVKDKKVGKS